MVFSTLLSSIPLITTLLSQTVSATIYPIPNAAYPDASVSEFTTKPDEFDGQKTTPYPNATSYEWWYFDVVSTSSNESVTIIFFETLNDAFPTLIPEAYLSVALTGTFANGTIFNFRAPLAATDTATVVTDGDGSSGIWGLGGFSWEGSKDLGKYVVRIDSVELGVKGTVTFDLAAPAHLPCELRVPGTEQNELLFPTVGWANAVPDSNAAVELTIGDTAVSYTGLGYHDKNWGNTPFVSAVQSWYWGHGRLGPYSIVWFDALTKTGEEYFSGYVTAGSSDLVQKSCATNAVVVRPFGENAEYPPTPATGDPPTGFDIKFDLGEGQVFDVKAMTGTVLIPAALVMGTYGRYIGPIQGELNGQVHTGVALWEQFKFGV